MHTVKEAHIVEEELLTVQGKANLYSICFIFSIKLEYELYETNKDKNVTTVDQEKKELDKRLK